MPVPREALGEISSALALTDAAATATAFGSGGGDSQTLETAGAVAAGCLAGAVTFPKGWRGEAGVQLLADWPCSCVRVMGETGVVQAAVRYTGSCTYLRSSSCVCGMSKALRCFIRTSVSYTHLTLPTKA